MKLAEAAKEEHAYMMATNAHLMQQLKEAQDSLQVSMLPPQTVGLLWGGGAN
jgi:hypothetical protein